jgi:hypothetical protein
LSAGRDGGRQRRRWRCAARIVLLAVAGLKNTEIAEQLGTGRPIVTKWRNRSPIIRLLRRGPHRSVRALNADIRTWIQTWNDDPGPFVWTKTADQILDSIPATATESINQDTSAFVSR